MHSLRIALVGVAALLAGCSLDASGFGELDAGLDDAPLDTNVVGSDTGDDGAPADTTIDPDTSPADSLVSDSTTDTTLFDTAVADTTADTSTDTTKADAPDAPPDAGCDLSACTALPSGATRVTLIDPTASCPAGFTANDVYELRAGNACSCACSLASSPTCPGTGTISVAYGNGACTTTDTLTSPGASVCQNIGSSVASSSHFRATAPGPSGGSCTPSSASDKNAVRTARRLCVPTPGACTAPVCSAPYVECIEISSGACPSSFPNARTVGSDVIVSCPSCTCGLSATCTGSLTFYAAASCGGASVTAPVDGVCNAAPSGRPASVASYRYVPNAPTASCAPSFTAAPGTATLVASRTICCR